MALLFGGALVGLPIGTYVLATLSSDLLNALIGASTMALALLLSVGVRKHFEREGLATLGAGILSGALKGTTGMTRPPVILLGLNQDWGQTRFRSTLVSYFTVIGVGGRTRVRAFRVVHGGRCAACGGRTPLPRAGRDGGHEAEREGVPYGVPQDGPGADDAGGGLLTVGGPLLAHGTGAL